MNRTSLCLPLETWIVNHSSMKYPPNIVCVSLSIDCAISSKSRSAQGCRVAISQDWNSSAPRPFGATAKVASKRLTPPWNNGNGEKTWGAETSHGLSPCPALGTNISIKALGEKDPFLFWSSLSSAIALPLELNWHNSPVKLSKI